MDPHIAGDRVVPALVEEPAESVPDGIAPSLPRYVVIVEAEQLHHDGWFVEAGQPGYSGSGALRTYDPNARPARGAFDLPASGRYQVWIRAYEGGGPDRRTRLSIGDRFSATTHGGRGRGFDWQLAGEVDLREGAVTVALGAEVPGGALIDAVALASHETLDPRHLEARFRVLHSEAARKRAYDGILARSAAQATQLPRVNAATLWLSRRDELRARIRAALGFEDWDERSPLKPRVLGMASFDGYRVERIVFESRPELLVTALAFVPDGPGPFPAIVRPVGHWPGPGKAGDVPLALSVGLAKRGYLVLTYDPFGQGERAIEGNGHDANLRLLLTGRTNLSIMLWDTVRALDYLLERPDVDPFAIGCTGASGGGLNTLFAGALDDRFSALAPAHYVVSWRSLFETAHVHDQCSSLPELASFTDMGEIAALAAPAPLALLSAIDDGAFPHDGAREAAAQAASVYELFEHPEAFRLVGVEGGHTLTAPMRELLYGFFDRALRGIGDGEPVPEPAFELPPEEALRCFEDGRLPEGSPTVEGLARGWMRAAIDRLEKPGGFDPERTRSRLATLLGSANETEAWSEIVHAGEVVVGGVKLQKLEIAIDEHRSIPVLLSVIEEHAPVHLIVDGALHTEHHPLFELARRGKNAAYVSPIGFGETAWDEHLSVADNLVLGEPVLAQRAQEIEIARRALAALPELEGSPFGLVAITRPAVWVGLFAQAVYGGFDAAALGPLPGSYLDFPWADVPLMAYVPRILLEADIPQILALAAERPLQVSLQTPLDGDWLAPLERSIASSPLTLDDAVEWLDGVLRPAEP